VYASRGTMVSGDHSGDEYRKGRGVRFDRLHKKNYDQPKGVRCGEISENPSNKLGKPHTFSITIV